MRMVRTMMMIMRRTVGAATGLVQLAWLRSILHSPSGKMLQRAVAMTFRVRTRLKQGAERGRGAQWTGGANHGCKKGVWGLRAGYSFTRLLLRHGPGCLQFRCCSRQLGSLV